MSELLLHLSDPHFGTEQAPVVAALERLVRRQAPGLAVLSGDITQRATAAQFAAARAFVDRLAVPRWVVIPGNHDIPLYDLARRMLRPYARYRAAFGADLAPAAESADWLVISHRTTRRWRHEDGQIDREQFEASAARLRRSARERPGQLRVVVLHQPPAVPPEADPKDVLHGAAPALAAWAEAGCDLVLAGHIHLACALPLAGEPTGEGRMWTVLAGTALSSRLRFGTANSVNLLRPDAGGGQRACRLERWDFDAASGEFQPALQQRLVLRGAS